LGSKSEKDSILSCSSIWGI